MISLLRAIINEAEAAELPFLLIGGYAVNAYGFARMTLDIDLLVPRGDAGRWGAFMEKFGYRLMPEQTAFVQFAAPMSTMPPVDLMLVNQPTFEKMAASACEKSIQDLAVKVPSALHLIALKLHAARHGRAERRSKDLTDIHELMLLNQIDVNGVPFREVCEKFGTPGLYEEIRRAASESE